MHRYTQNKQYATAYREYIEHIKVRAEDVENSVQQTADRQRYYAAVPKLERKVGYRCLLSFEYERRYSTQKEGNKRHTQNPKGYDALCKRFVYYSEQRTKAKCDEVGIQYF